MIPLKTYNNLSNHDNFKIELHRIGGVYGFIHINEEEDKIQKKYIGSSNSTISRSFERKRF